MANESEKLQRDWLGHGVQYLAIVVTVILFWFATQASSEHAQDEAISKISANQQAIMAEVHANELVASTAAAHSVVVDGKLDAINTNLATVLTQIGDLKESWSHPSKK